MQTIPTAVIYRGQRARQLVPQNVEQIAASIAHVGLLNPILVRPVVRYHGGIDQEVFEIVAGCHRYAAVCKLGWTEVDCKVIATMDDLHVELAEIDENLVRANLSSAQEASAMARRKEIYEELHPETRHGVFRGNQHKEVVADSATTRFTKATADVTGKSERIVQEAVARGKQLGADADLVVGTSLDSIRELNALAKLPPEERKPLIDRARAGERVSAKVRLADEPLNDFETKEKWIAQGMAWWNKGHSEWREEFRERTVDAPVMDRRYAHG